MFDYLLIFTTTRQRFVYSLGQGDDTKSIGLHIVEFAFAINIFNSAQAVLDLHVVFGFRKQVCKREQKIGRVCQYIIQEKPKSHFSLAIT